MKDCYNLYFNANDIFNHFIHKRNFPICQRSGHEANFTDFMHSMIQMNLLTLYHELNQICRDDRLSRSDFTLYLCELLMKEAEVKVTQKFT